MKKVVLQITITGVDCLRPPIGGGRVTRGLVWLGPTNRATVFQLQVLAPQPLTSSSRSTATNSTSGTASAQQVLALQPKIKGESRVRTTSSRSVAKWNSISFSPWKLSILMKLNGIHIHLVE